MSTQQVALITGAASGIGLAITEALADTGRTVVLADVNFQAGEAVAKRLGGTFIQADLSKREGCKSLAETVLN